MIFRTAICFLLSAFILVQNPIAEASEGTQEIHEEVQIEQTETGFYYTVKKGDTLWGLSQRFLDSSWVWPGLWNENKQIPNPHLIYPGQKIRLFLKKDVDSSSINNELSSSDSEATPVFFFKEMDKAGFILSTKLIPDAVVLRSTGDKLQTLMSEGQEVFILPENGTKLSVGDIYMTCRLTDSIRAKGEEKSSFQYFVTGRAEVTDTGDGYGKAMITTSFRTVEKGDLLIPYTPNSLEIDLKEKIPNLKGTILKAEEGQVIFSDSAFAFIDKGTTDGVQVGQVYAIFKEDTLTTGKGENDVISLPTKDLGSIIVVRAEEQYSTVIVLKSIESVESGTKFH